MKRICLIISMFLTIFSAMLLPVTNVFAFEPDFSLASKAVYLLNLDTDTELFSMNATKRMHPASLTKVMTYLVTVDHVQDIYNTKVMIKKDILDMLLGTDSSMANIQAGDELTVKQLLQCLLIPSGNDAAMVLADYVGGGSIEKFVDMMNEKAVQLNCNNTHFINPHGLEDPEHYTTAYDLSLITKEAMKHPDFLEIASTVKTYYREGDERTFLVTTNGLINPNDPHYYMYAKGIKTGHCDESGYCLISMASYEGVSYLCVVLGAPSQDQVERSQRVHGEMIDSKNLYRWAFLNFSVKPISATSKPITKVKLNYVWNEDSMILVASPSSMLVLPIGVDMDSLDIVPDKVDSIDAPIQKGQKISKAKVYYANQLLGEVDLVADKTVEKSKILEAFATIRNIFKSKILLLCIAILVLLIIVYCSILIIQKRKMKRKKYILRKYNNYKR